MAKDERKFYQTKTFYGCLLIALAGALESLGINGALPDAINIVGLPAVIYTVADRLRK